MQDRIEQLKESMAFLKVWERFNLFYVGLIEFNKTFNNEQTKEISEFVGEESDNGRLPELFDFFHKYCIRYTIKANRILGNDSEKEDLIKEKIKELKELIK